MMKPLFVVLCIVFMVATDGTGLMAYKKTLKRPRVRMSGKHFYHRTRMNFDEQIIEGKLNRRKSGMVVGSVDEQDNGILILRENFIDKMALDIGERIE